MKVRDIRNALKERLADGAPFGVSFAWPNVEPTGPRPYFDTSFTGIARTGDGIEGNQILEETGQFSVIVVADQGEGEDPASDIADIVSAMFPEGLKLQITNASIAITSPPDIRGGFATNSDYRIPVIIKYHALRI